MSQSIECPKCGQRMIGPRWDRKSDCLEYRCTCGFEKATPTRDNHEQAEHARRLTELLHGRKDLQ